MKSYLGLIPIAAKAHRRQNRMTLLCIIFAVFLVTAVFSMTEMCVRMEQTRLLQKHGVLSFQDIIGSAMGQTVFPVAAVLFLLILIAGVLMVSGSINSNVSQRTKFFGMMRCIGMSKQQIIRFVRLEALNWCKIAIPVGVALGIAVTWGLCAVLRFLVGEEFSNIPLFGISGVGILSGVVLGLVTVLLAAGAPARRAAKVSPAAAAAGNAVSAKEIRHAVNPRFLKIETALGIHHAVSARKNLILMVGSFALSIILFLSFSVLIDFAGYLMPQSAADADIEIACSDGSNAIDYALPAVISDMDGVENVFGRRSCFDVPAETAKAATRASSVDLISYGQFDLACLKKDDMLKRGSDIEPLLAKNSNAVLATWDKNSPLAIGDKITVGDKKLEIAGLLKYDPFSSDGMTNGKITLITSEDLFSRLTGITDYSLLMIQTTKDVTDGDVAAIKSRLGAGNYLFSDRRDQRTSGTYIAFVSCVYGFLMIIVLVTVLNIINSISMSVAARIRQYGVMRAVGMAEHQITKIIAAEAFTYAFLGCAVGCIIGLLLSKGIFDTLISTHFGYAVWSVPVIPLGIILLFFVFAAIIAVYAPAKRIRSISVTETINEL